METTTRLVHKKPCGIPLSDRLDSDSRVGRRKIRKKTREFLGLKAAAIKRGTAPTFSKRNIAFVNRATKNGVQIAPQRLPIKAARITRRKLSIKPCGLPVKIAWSTIPPRKGACNMLEVLVINKVALTKEREVAICLVRSPASRRD